MAGTAAGQLTDALIDEIAARIVAGRRVRRTLTPGGRLNLDRPLPFLFVYRPGPDRRDDALASLISGEAAYFIAPTSARSKGWTQRLTSRLATTLAADFGGFLIVEVWPGPMSSEGDRAEQAAAAPAFRIVAPQQTELSPAVERLTRSLQRIRLNGLAASVTTEAGGRPAPPGTARLMAPVQCANANVRLVGLEVAPVYVDPETGSDLPLVRRSLARQMSRALRQAAFEFARHETNDRSLHYHALGRRTFVKAVTTVDAELADVAGAFDLLMTVTPTNADAAYRVLQRSKYGRAPRFTYRPATVDPSLLKRRLFNIPIEQVEDPTLEEIFREKRRELELKLSLVSEREGPRFLPMSVALYGGVDPSLLATATDLLRRLPVGGGTGPRTIDAAAFAARAEAEFARLRQADPSVAGRVELRDDTVSLMVSSGSLLIGRAMKFPVSRVEPLIQHEVGTHAVTYWNGRAQPFRLLADGLASHDELQEGLAVFAEYLVGGLTPGRLRTLAGRVVAARAVMEGAAFLDTFRLLRDDHGFSPRPAFLVAMRVHRGGGFIKDAVYLRGLQKVVDYLRSGRRLDTLYVGKMATQHASVIEELQRRRVLRPPPLRPSFLDEPDSFYRVQRLDTGLGLHDLVDP